MPIINGNGGLDQLATMVSQMPQQEQQPMYDTSAIIPGMGVNVSEPENPQMFNGALQSLAGGYLQQQKKQKGDQFLKGVHDIMSANMQPSDRVNKLISLKAQHGTDYGLGLEDILKQLNLQDKTDEWKPATKQDALDFESAKKSDGWKPGTQQEAMDYERAKAGMKPPTLAQETTALYAGRIKQANDVFRKMEGYINTLPVVGTKLNEWAPNFMKSGDFQAYEQAQRNYLNAVLRRESGAVISPSEFAEGRKQYFPQPGDNPQVLEQKRQNRELVEMNFKSSAGNAYAPYEATDPNLFGKQSSAPQQNIQLPPTITKTSQAMQYLVQQGMDEATARQYLQQVLSAQ